MTKENNNIFESFKLVAENVNWFNETSKMCNELCIFLEKCKNDKYLIQNIKIEVDYPTIVEVISTKDSKNLENYLLLE